MLKDYMLISPPTLTVAQAFFLGRLERLAAFREVPNHALEPWQKALISRAIYSTYRDCLDHGLAPEAQFLIYGEKTAA